MLAWILSVSTLALGVGSATHALLRKRDHRSALGWIIVCIWVPIFGPLTYWLFGVNRIRRRAARLRAPLSHSSAHVDENERGRVPGTLTELLRLSNAVNRRPLLAGNRIEPLVDGEEAYEAMLDSIAAAQRSVLLASYIFQNDSVGRRFVQALAAAQRRGVDVRVLVDGIGEWYSPVRIGRALARERVPFARFLRPSLLRPGLHMNLRNHRKLLVVDDRTGFTGGMNIASGHCTRSASARRAIHDLHFRVRGPVVRHLAEVFLEDWDFATGEVTTIDGPPPDGAGTELCRGISSGPDDHFEKLSWILVGATSSAEHSVAIMTPYFLPNRELIGALCAAALRGVEVDVVMPRRNNIPVIAWATQSMLWELIEYGVRVWYQPGAFDHTKLFVVDGIYSLVGSTNLDARSLRLNFEFNLEIHGEETGGRLRRHFEDRRDASTRIDRPSLDRRPIAVKLRDATARLFTPYL